MSHKDYTNTRPRIQDIAKYSEKENSRNKSHAKNTESTVVCSIVINCCLTVFYFKAFFFTINQKLIIHAALETDILRLARELLRVASK